ncbi:MAG: DegT/DnrJ/EryC1/StrS family aminotransferase [Puniceicoccales bacterium]|nr:DegT/DnrJ/EryC1/StrS family aminotransferase [Puniceicoccales bacterium]
MNRAEEPIAFIDLKAQYRRIKNEVDRAVIQVLESGAYIMGPEVRKLEEQLTLFVGSRHSLTCANGTDALTLGLMSLRLRPGEAVFVPSLTFAATAEAVSLLGGIPLFVDVREDTFNLDIESLKNGFQMARKEKLNPVGIIAVDLFGQPADYAPISDFARDNCLWLMADSAQGFGATYQGSSVCACRHCHVATTSFFPAKPLGCYGDGGAVFTNDDERADLIDSFRAHGRTKADKYDHVRRGLNSRLDTVQAAILMEKLKIFPDEIKARNRVADIYGQTLQDICRVPVINHDTTHVWAQYTLVLPPEKNREKLMDYLAKRGIPTVVYYPKPLHLQTAYKDFPHPNLPASERLRSRVLSLPMHPYLSTEQCHRIAEEVMAGIRQL